MTKRSMLTPKRLLAIVAAMLLISSFLKADLAIRLASPLHNVLAAAVSPLTKPLTRLSVKVRPPKAQEVVWKDRADLEQEYGRALRLIRQLEYELVQAYAQIAQYSQIEETFGLSGRRLVGARVAASSSDRSNPVLTIDRGTNKGVREGLAVASGFHLVGEVIGAGPLTADVRVITAAKTELQVRIVPPRAEIAQREVVAWLQVQDDGTFIAETSLETPVSVGDLAHLSDARWPQEAQGFVVGQVTSVAEDPENPHLSRHVVVTPILPLSQLDRVTVLVPTQ